MEIIIWLLNTFGLLTLLYGYFVAVIVIALVKRVLGGRD